MSSRRIGKGHVRGYKKRRNKEINGDLQEEEEKEQQRQPRGDVRTHGIMDRNSYYK